MAELIWQWLSKIHRFVRQFLKGGRPKITYLHVFQSFMTSANCQGTQVLFLMLLPSSHLPSCDPTNWGIWVCILHSCRQPDWEYLENIGFLFFWHSRVPVSNIAAFRKQGDFLVTKFSSGKRYFLSSGSSWRMAVELRSVGVTWKCGFER